MTGIMKAQIDWIPLSEGAVRPSQGVLAVMQVCGGSRLSMPDAYSWPMDADDHHRISPLWQKRQEFDEDERMKPSSYYDRIVM